MSKVSLVMVVVMIVIVMTVGHITKVKQELMQQVFIWDIARINTLDLC